MEHIVANLARTVGAKPGFDAECVVSLMAAVDHAAVVKWLTGDGRPSPEVPYGRSAVVIVGDDPPAPRRSLGPGVFHERTLRQHLRAATHVAVMAGKPVAALYRQAAELAALGGVIVLVECTVETEAAWVELVKVKAPQADFVLATPVSGRA